jgi:hypothetical protein
LSIDHSGTDFKPEGAGISQRSVVTQSRQRKATRERQGKFLIGGKTKRRTKRKTKTEEGFALASD